MTHPLFLQRKKRSLFPLCLLLDRAERPFRDSRKVQTSTAFKGKGTIFFVASSDFFCRLKKSKKKYSFGSLGCLFTVLKMPQKQILLIADTIIFHGHFADGSSEKNPHPPIRNIRCRLYRRSKREGTACIGSVPRYIILWKRRKQQLE